MSTRLNININTETAEYIVAERERGTTATETIRRAISVYKFWREAEQSGKRLQTVDRDGEIQEVRLIV